MTKLNTLAATLAAATLAGCATTTLGDPFEKQAPAAPKTASATFGSTRCEAQIGANNAANAAKAKLGRTATPNTDLPTSGECVGIYIKSVTNTQPPSANTGNTGRKAGSAVPTEGSAKIYPTESHFVRLDLPNCERAAAVPGLVSQGLGAVVNIAGQAAGNGAFAQTGKRAAQEAVNNAQQPARTPANGISAACKADLSEAYDLASKAIAEMKTAYAKAQGVPSTTVQVIQIPTFDPKYWGPAAPSKK